jgi:hypothetical protein
MAHVSVPVGRGHASLAHVVLRLDLDSSAGVHGPLDGAQLRDEFVVELVDVDLAVLEEFSQVPVVLRSSVDEPLLVERCLPPLYGVTGRPSSIRRSYTPAPTPTTSTTAVTKSFLSGSASMSRIAFAMWPVVVMVSALWWARYSRIQPPSLRMPTVSSSPKRAMSHDSRGRRLRSMVRFWAA